MTSLIQKISDLRLLFEKATKEYLTWEEYLKLPLKRRRLGLILEEGEYQINGKHDHISIISKGNCTVHINSICRLDIVEASAFFIGSKGEGLNIIAPSLKELCIYESCNLNIFHSSLKEFKIFGLKKNIHISLELPSLEANALIDLSGMSKKQDANLLVSDSKTAQLLDKLNYPYIRKEDSVLKDL